MTTSTPPTPSPGVGRPGRRFRDRRATPRPAPGDPVSTEADLPLGATLRRHWPEYGIEALFVCTLVLVAGALASWLQATEPANLAWQRALAGSAVGGLLVAMIYSPWGRRSGTHMNPAITLAYLRLGKIGGWDAVFYLAAQVGAACAAVALLQAAALTPAMPAQSPAVGPAASGGFAWPGTALLVQWVLSAGAMLLIVSTSNHARWFRLTGVLVALLATIAVAWAGLPSGLGMNMAWLLAVDACGATGRRDWINLLPPLLGMLLGAQGWRLLTGRAQPLCAKLAHNTHGRCIFRCQHPYQTRALALAAIRRRAPG